MKYLICFLVITQAALLSANEDLKWVDEHISAIKPKRVGISDSKIDNVKNPMKITVIAKVPEKMATEESTEAVVPKKVNPLKLKAIMNSKALIGTKWFLVYENVQGYTIKEIGKKSVLLEKNGEKRTLKLYTPNKSLKISSK